MHRLATTFILGYHGCDREVGERILAGEQIQPSDNDYDWLGPGAYFWEADPERGLSFAREAQARNSDIHEPFVVGAVIELGNCLDFTTEASIDHAVTAHRLVIEEFDKIGLDLPKNSPNLLRRDLDCAVVRAVHVRIAQFGLPPIDTVRGIFVEGSPIFPGSGIFARTHVQIAVCNPTSVKGVFRVNDSLFAKRRHRVQ